MGYFFSSISYVFLIKQIEQGQIYMNVVYTGFDSAAAPHCGAPILDHQGQKINRRWIEAYFPEFQPRNTVWDRNQS